MQKENTKRGRECGMQQKELVLNEIMLPSKANWAGNIHGGEIMKMMDSAAFAVTSRYCHYNVVTARVDESIFHQPVKVGDLVTCSVKIIFTGKSSMEVKTTISSDDLKDGHSPVLVLSAFTTMVALDRNGKPTAIPKLEINSKQEAREFADALKRYQIRKGLFQSVKEIVA